MEGGSGNTIFELGPSSNDTEMSTIHQRTYETVLDCYSTLKRPLDFWSLVLLPLHQVQDLILYCTNYEAKPMLQTTQLCQAQIGGLQQVQSGPIALCD